MAGAQVELRARRLALGVLQAPVLGLEEVPPIPATQMHDALKAGEKWLKVYYMGSESVLNILCTQ